MSCDLTSEIFGIQLQSPFVLGSGPISYGAAGMIRAHQAGFGAVVTKTIRDAAAENPFPHIALAGRNTLINAEKWADLPGEQYVHKEIPRAKAAGAVVIASIGHTPQEVENGVAPVDRAGADIIELVSYREETILAMTRRAKAITSKPVLVKLSPNWADPVQAAREALAAGADGITAMDSIGPVLRIDITTAKPLVGGAKGLGWLTGAAIKPITLALVAQVALASDKPIIGLGGVMDARDAAEMLMAGASLVGLCSAPILKGVEYVGSMNRRLAALLSDLGYASAAQASRAALPHLPAREVMEKFAFAYDRETCTLCRQCVKACPYDALQVNEEQTMARDETLCRLCGLCITVCQPGALKEEGSPPS